MFNKKGLAIRIGFINTLFCCAQLTMAESRVDYNSVDISSLQNQYRQQLIPKTSKKVVTKTTVKHRKIKNQIQSKELLQYQRLLANTLPNKNQHVQRPVNKPVRHMQKQAKESVRNQTVLPVSTPVQTAPRRGAIFEAASSGNVRLIGQLISQGINVNQSNSERETALHMAAAKGQYSAVIYLLNHGANIHARTINNWLPIHHATRFRHAQIANYLKQRGSRIHARTSDGLSAVDMAKALNDRRILGIFGVR